MTLKRILIIAFLVTGLLSLSTIQALALAPASPAAQTTTPTPPMTPTPTPPDGGGVTDIIYHLMFPAETISEALTGIFNKAAEKEATSMSEQIAQWTQAIGEIVQAPSQGEYSAVAQSSLPVAAALAPALFLLRLALYHWNRLVGQQDSGMNVVSDWVTAGVLAAVSGVFLDMLVRLGWWMIGKVIGETGALALAFVQVMSISSIVKGVTDPTMFGGLISIGLSLGALLAVAGMLFAFASANAVLFILAVLAVPVAVAGVIPQMRWLRTLWLKAVVIIALLPMVAGGIFKAGVSAASVFSEPGLLSGLIRVLWLWGATGLLLSLAGILGKMTISTTTDALGQMVNAVKQVASVAALAASGVGAAGAGAGAAAGAAGAGGSGGAGAAIGAGGAGMGSSQEAAMSHLNAAQDLTQRAGVFDALGLHAPAQFLRSQAHGEELGARQAELSGRMQRFSSEPVSPATDDVGFSPSVNSAILSNFNGSADEFKQGFAGLSRHIQDAGLSPEVLAAQYPRDTALMTRAYLDRQTEIDAAGDPLLFAADLAQADNVKSVLTKSSAPPTPTDLGQAGNSQA
jgi:hypothetical protein